MRILELGTSGQDVLSLQCALAAAGFLSGGLDGSFGPGTQADVEFFQSQNGLTVDGIVGPHTAAALGLTESPPITCVVPGVTIEMVTPMFPDTPVENIQANLPYVLNELASAGLADQQMILMALATIRAEVGSFLPIGEFQSHFNTSPGGQPFDLYDHRTDLGNQGPSDGSDFRGRGFIQLTGRSNYQVHGEAVGLGGQLLSNPVLAHDPATAAKLMASFLKAHESEIRTALAANDLKEARRLVNGGINGLDEFTNAFNIGLGLLPEQVPVATPAA